MEELYADVIVDISHEKLDKSFQYRVPERLRTELETGMCVTVPFGNGNKLIKGYVISMGENCKFDPAKTKAIHDIVKGGVGVEILLARRCKGQRRRAHERGALSPQLGKKDTHSRRALRHSG